MKKHIYIYGCSRHACASAASLSLSSQGASMEPDLHAVSASSQVAPRPPMFWSSTHSEHTTEAPDGQLTADEPLGESGMTRMSSDTDRPTQLSVDGSRRKKTYGSIGCWSKCKLFHQEWLKCFPPLLRLSPIPTSKS